MHACMQTRSHRDEFEYNLPTPNVTATQAIAHGQEGSQNES